MKNVIFALATLTTTTAIAGDCEYVRDYQNDSRHTAQIQTIIGVTADGVKGPATRGAISAFLSGCGMQTSTSSVATVASTEAALAAERARLDAEKAELEERKRQKELRRIKRKIKREFVSTSDFAKVYGTDNDISRVYEKAKRALRDRGIYDAGVIDVHVDYKPRDWRFNHVITFRTNSEIIRVTSDTHMFRWNRIQSVDIQERDDLDHEDNQRGKKRK